MAIGKIYHNRVTFNCANCALITVEFPTILLHKCNGFFHSKTWMIISHYILKPIES